MHKKSTVVILIVAIILGNVSGMLSVSDLAEASSISNSKYSGIYYMKGGYKKVTEENGAYFVGIKKIKKNKVKFYVEYMGRNGSPAYGTGYIEAKIKGNKALFHWTDSWGNLGKGTIWFVKKHRIKLNMNVIKSAASNRATLDTNGAKVFLFLRKN